MEESEVFIQNLKSWGCDVEGALERFLGDMELYQDCLRAVVEDKSFEELKAALQEGRMEAAFEASHTLKGVLANLGLTPMYEITVKIVEPLRKENGAGLMPYYEELMQANCYLKNLLELE